MDRARSYENRRMHRQPGLFCVVVRGRCVPEAAAFFSFIRISPGRAGKVEELERRYAKRAFLSCFPHSHVKFEGRQGAAAIRTT